MKTGIYLFLRFLIKIGLHGYFKKISVRGGENIPKNCPLILVANHQNALLDPLLIATHLPLRPYFLTRASVFKHSLAAYLLGIIRMLPVFRIRDGFSSLNQNQQTFEQTYHILHENGALLIFAEGNHSLVRNIRPLSKGFTRMAFGAREHFPDIMPIILPIGIEYSAHKRSGSWVRLTVGKGIPVDCPASEAGKLTKKVEAALKSLVVDLPEEGYRENVQLLLDNEVDLSNKSEVANFFEGKPLAYTVPCRSTLANKLMKLFHLPLYWIWLGILAPKVKDDAFTGTFKFLIGWLGILPYYLLLLGLCFHPALGSWVLPFLIMAPLTLWRNENCQE